MAYLTTIPFAGFYGSIFESIIDSWQDREAESREEQEASESYYPESFWPEELRLDAAAHSDAIYWAMNYRQAQEAIARDYAAAFNDWLAESLGWNPGLVFESLHSPKEYNFTTDRIFCHIPEESARKLLIETAASGKLAEAAKARFTSRDGFISFYPADIADWPKDSADWDFNQWGTVLEAIAESFDLDDWDIFYPLAESDYLYCDSACDWEAYESRVQAARAEKLGRLIDSDMDSAVALLAKYPAAQLLLPDCPYLSSDDESAVRAALGDWQAAHYRCPFTLELPFPESRA